MKTSTYYRVETSEGVEYMDAGAYTMDEAQASHCDTCPIPLIAYADIPEDGIVRRR